MRSVGTIELQVRKLEKGMRMVEVWEKGGYPYALLPLTLPPPGGALETTDTGAVKAELKRLQAGTRAPMPAPESIEQLFWFRWITGNQAAMAMWQLIDEQLALVLADPPDEAAARNAEAMFNGYSLLLIYVGAQTRATYHGLIRPAMARHHRSFSGQWAQDNIAVMKKLEQLKAQYRGREKPAFIDSLIEASRRTHRIHMAVAVKLVPSGQSLLRSYDSEEVAQPTEDTVRLYDTFYVTCREPVSHGNVAAQLLLRLRLTQHDIETNGLYPERVSLDERPEALVKAAAPLAVEDRGPELLRRAGEAAVASL